MSLRQKIAVLTCVLAGALLGLAVAVDAWLVTPWIATLVNEPGPGQLEVLLQGAAARRVALVWVALVAGLAGFRVADRVLARPLSRLAAEVSRRRVSGPAWAESTPGRLDEVGVIAREFGQTYDELTALRGSAARAEALQEQLKRMEGVDFAVRRLAVSARRLGVAVEAGEGQLETRLQALSDEVSALRELTRDARSGTAGSLSAVSPAPARVLESPAAPAGSMPDPLPEAEPC